MQVFLEAATDNPLSAVVSSPHVMGHEIVGMVVEAGSAVQKFARGRPRRGLPMAAVRLRGLAPCAACQRGDYPLCEHFFDGRIERGCTSATAVTSAAASRRRWPARVDALSRSPTASPLERGGARRSVLGRAPRGASRATRAPARPSSSTAAARSGCSRSNSSRSSFRGHHPGRRPQAAPRAPLSASARTSSSRRAASELVARDRRASRGAPPQAVLRHAVDPDGRRQDLRHRRSSGTLEIGVRIVRPRATIVMVGVVRAPPLRVDAPLLQGDGAARLERLRHGALERKRGARHRALPRPAANERLALDGIVSHRYPLEKFGDAFMAVYDKRSRARSRCSSSPEPPGAQRREATHWGVWGTRPPSRR